MTSRLHVEDEKEKQVKRAISRSHTISFTVSIFSKIKKTTEKKTIKRLKHEPPTAGSSILKKVKYETNLQ